MSKDTSKRKPGRLRRIFRYTRVALLTLLLILVSLVTYLNQVGVPRFVKNAFLRELEERGLKAQFSRLSWGWHEGVVAENLFIERPGDGEVGPLFSADRAALRFDMDAMGRLRLRLDSAELLNGNLIWRLSDTNLSDQLRLADINTVLRFGTNDSVELVQFKSKFKGLDLSVSGTLTNQKQIGTSASTNRSAPDLQVLNEAMNRVANYLTNFEFSATPELKLRFDADAGNWSDLKADLRVRLPQTTSSWGKMDQTDFLARVRPNKDAGLDESIEMILTGGFADTPWGKLRNWEIHTRTVPVMQVPINSSNQVYVSFSQLETEYGTVEDGTLDFSLEALAEDSPDEMNIELTLGGRRFVTEWATADEMMFAYLGKISRTNWLPIQGTNTLTLMNVESSHGEGKYLKLSVAQKPQQPDWKSQADESWGLWKHLEPYILDFSIEGEAVDAQRVQVEAAKLSGRWAAPHFVLEEAVGKLYGGDFLLSGDIDVTTGGIGFAAVTDWDYHALDHLFSEKFGKWFQPYQWETAPHIEVSGVLAWPDWNVYKPNWREEVGPTLGLSGWFEVDNPSYGPIPGLKASSHFYFTNFIWNLPDLTMVRPEGTTVAVYDGNDLTKDYVWQIVADINPTALTGVFLEPQRRVFQHFTNHVTPHIEGKIWGRWRAHHLIGFEATVSAPQIEIRGELLDQLDAHVAYTNQFLVVSNGTIQQSNRVAHGESIGIDLLGKQMHFTNVTSSLPPMSVARAIGPVTAGVVEPYDFEEPPKIAVNGSLGLKGHDLTDLRFDIDANRFNWWAFHIDDINGHLHWRQNRLTMTNVVADFYDGAATGFGNFIFYTNRPTDVTFNATLADAQFQPLVRDVFGSTNNLYGKLSGELKITEARSDSRDTWNGYGHMDLQNGMLWDIPIFAIFSPLFNAISPGLGSSQADEASANFVMINGTTISTDLEMKSTELSMLYKGSVDHLGNVNALMEARILKEAGPFGPLISTALRPLTKLFEYQVTGTLKEPEAEPIFIPKFLLLPLEPFKALGGLLTPSPANSTK